LLLQATLSQRYKRVLPLSKTLVLNRRLHLLSDILTIAILSVMAGGEWEDMELYGVSKTAVIDVSGF